MLCILTFMWICGFRGDTNKKNVFFSTEFFITTISDFLSHTKRGCWVLEIHAKNLHWNSVNKIHRQHRTIFSPSYSWLISHLCNWGTRNIHPWCALNSHSHRWKPEPQGLLNIMNLLTSMTCIVFISGHKWLKKTHQQSKLGYYGWRIKGGKGTVV